MSHVNISTTRVVIAVFVIAITALAGTEQIINYQGFLSDAGGQPITGDRQMVFTIYDAPEAGSILWTSGQVLIHIDEGLFSYAIGQDPPLPPGCFADTGRWLGIQIPPDTEIAPRTRLASTPYSLQALNADTAKVGGGWTTDESKQQTVLRPTSNEALVAIGPEVFTGKETSSMLTINTLSPDQEYLHLGDSTMTVSHDGLVSLRGSGLAIQNSALGFPEPASRWSDDIVVSSDDAVIGLYSSSTGDYGSGITLSEVEGTGIATLTDKWAILRETSNAPLGGGCGLRITYGDQANQAINSTFMRITKSGSVGIGTETPMGHRLSVESEGGDTGGSTVFVNNINEVDGIGMMVENRSNKLTLLLTHRGTDPNDNILRCDSYAGGYHAVFWVKNSGRVICKELELTGGTDVAEPFEITNGKILPEGAMVVIDELNPGKLTLSDRPYDTRVAGVISGAGGIKPGVTLTQESIFDQGQKVAISGRVYCLADASFGAIVPGDLLTTSTTPGHAMKASDRNKAYGAVIGKAMTGLEEGQGLVLVLVSLQ